MAFNDFGSNDNVRAEVFREKVFRSKLPETFFYKFMDFPIGAETIPEANYILDENSGMPIGVKSGDNAIVSVARELLKAQGDKINFPDALPLTGKPILGSSGKLIWDNAQVFSASKQSLVLEQYSGAITDKSPLGVKRTMFDLLKQYQGALSSWQKVQLDQLIFDAIYDTVATPTSIVYGGTATSDATLASADKLTMALLRKLKVIAQTRNDGARNIVEPIMINGKPHYIYVGPPDQIYDLKEDSEYKQVLQNAAVRGDQNPIFAGAEFVTLDGIIVFSHENCPTTTNYGSGGDVTGARGKLLGKNAILLALGAAPDLRYEERDFGTQKGWATVWMMKAQRNTFGSNSKDCGSIEVRTARSAVAV